MESDFFLKISDLVVLKFHTALCPCHTKTTCPWQKPAFLQNRKGTDKLASSQVWHQHKGLREICRELEWNKKHLQMRLTFGCKITDAFFESVKMKWKNDSCSLEHHQVDVTCVQGQRNELLTSLWGFGALFFCFFLGPLPHLIRQQLLRSEDCAKLPLWAEASVMQPRARRHSGNANNCSTGWWGGER